MKNKRGFILVETIIVMSVVMIALIGIYNSYVTVINKARQKMYYDNINDVYRLNVINKILNNEGYNVYLCSNSCNDLKSNLFPNITNEVYIIKYDHSSNPEQINSTYLGENYVNSFKRYLQTTNYNIKNLIILRYVDNEDHEHYASLEV